MTAKEKFEARARELGLENELTKEAAAAVELDGEIVVLVENEEEFRECHFDDFESLKENIPDFKNTCIQHWLYYDDPSFFQKLCQWLLSTAPCPLYPVDVWSLSGIEMNSTIEFKDDDAEEAIKQMDVRELIEFVNKCFTDVPDRDVIHMMGSQDAWDRFESEEVGVIKDYFANSEESFDFGDSYFCWDKDRRMLFSFCTADELINLVSMDILVDNYEKLHA